jgi:hypothetical protein
MKVPFKYFIKKEIALLYSSKRIGQLMIIIIYFAFFADFQCYQYHLSDDFVVLDNLDKIMMLMTKLLLPSIVIAFPSVVLFQFFFGIKANYMDKIMTIPLPFTLILKRKYYFYCFLSFIMFLLLIPAVFWGLTWLELLSALMFAVGPLSFFGLWSSIFNDKKIDLKASVFFNYQGNTAKQYLLIVFFPCLLFFPIFCLTYFVSESMALLFMSVTGLIFIALHKIWITRLAIYYDKNILDKIEKIRQ